MGGRIASMLAADGAECDGLLLLAYPLHPAGEPERLRDAHLPQIKIPVLCFNGTRDALCRRDLMERVLTTVQAPWQMHWLEGADHSFHVLKSSGRTDDQVLEEIGGVSRRWLAGRQFIPNALVAGSPPIRMDISHERRGHRGAFVIDRDGKRLAELSYTVAGTRIILDHTQVDDALRGTGAGQQLVQAAVEWARAEDRRLLPLCPFARSVFDRMPEYRDVLAD